MKLIPISDKAFANKKISVSHLFKENSVSFALLVLGLVTGFFELSVLTVLCYIIGMFIANGVVYLHRCNQRTENYRRYLSGFSVDCLSEALKSELDTKSKDVIRHYVMLHHVNTIA